MKRILVLLVCISLLLPCLLLPVSAETLNGTLIRKSAADPWMCYYNGYYFLTVTGSTKIAVFQSRSLAGFDTLSLNSNIVYDSAQDPTVKEVFGQGASLSGTWSPELHYFSEEEAPGASGWYMFLALRKDTGDSSEIQAVVLKSTTASPKGPYGHPTTGKANHSQPLLDENGELCDNWVIGQSVLKISEGPYAGIYTTWVEEVGRGLPGTTGQFNQKLMIAKMKNPWSVEGEGSVLTIPNQGWEYAGSSKTHPRVVEGATALYGTRGDIYITYSGSGYWSDYGLGQLTWTGEDPLQTSSWVKLSSSETPENKNHNPIFQAKKATDLRGAGHASFVYDKEGKGFLVYHAYPYENGKKAKGRNAYIEPYYIDYTQHNGASYGVIHMGANDNRIPAETTTMITFANLGDDLGVPTVTAAGGGGVTLSMSAENAEGYTIYRSTDGEVFTYLATVNEATYVDSTAEYGSTYYYRAYAYRNQQLSTHSETVSAVASEEAEIPQSTDTQPDTSEPGAASDNGNGLVIGLACGGVVVVVCVVCAVLVLKKKKK